MLYESEQGNISIALAGDAMITRQMRPFREENFLKMQSLLQNADASIVNLEMLFHTYEMSWQGKSSYSF